MRFPFKASCFLTACVTLLILSAAPVKADLLNSLLPQEKVTVVAKTLPAYADPALKTPAITFYEGMQVEPIKMALEGQKPWMQVQGGSQKLWVPVTDDAGELTVGLSSPEKGKIIDAYGILDQPHRYAVKLVKLPGAKGRLETYEKTDDGYKLRHVYDPVTYPKEGPKTTYGDLKTVGGPIVRYMYRTEQSAMTGRDKNGSKFGVYKLSYPMPHDALPFLTQGLMGTAGYNKIPVINYVGEGKNRVLQPHPHSLMGADILIHTAVKGSIGCIDVENEDMAFLYFQDLVTENNREIIPLVIYDEDVEAPEIGQLF